MKIRATVRTLVTITMVISSWAEARKQVPVPNVATRPSAANAGQVKRPPQFILLSFDGSLSIPFWKETRSFAERHGIGFTYFISGVYLLSGSTTQQYQAPGKKSGRSDIGFGKSDQDVEQRIHEIVKARSEGLEIGSHANGHFDGSKWTLEQWRSEFNQFHKFVEQVFTINPIRKDDKNEWDALIPGSIRGYRAPLLGVNKDMYQNLAELGYAYDTSAVGDSSKWPSRRSDGMWSFPLQSIRLAGSGKRTLTMDYNILVAQCKNEFLDASGTECKANSPEKIKEYEQETYETYVNLFLKNYYGNRAPLVIGHHFSLWNKGAYWKALQRFAADVCNQEEVRCITYEEMLAWTNLQIKAKSLAVVGSYEQGLFPKMPKIGTGLKLTHALTYNVEAQLLLLEQSMGSAGLDVRNIERLTVDNSSPVDLKNEDSKALLENAEWQEHIMKGDLSEAHKEFVDEQLLQDSRIP